MLGDRLKIQRTNKKLRQEDIAAKIGIARTTYAMYEQDKREPDNETLQKLADFFDVKIDYLLGRTNDPSPSEIKEHHEKSRNELLHELTDDPDDFFFLDGYLNAPEEEKKELRRHYFELKKQMRESNVKSSKPSSLFDITEGIRKDSDK